MLHQSPSLHGLQVHGLATTQQFKAHFPCTRAKPHLHKRHNKTLWLVILNHWLTAPCWPQGLVIQQLRYTHTHMASAQAVQTHFFFSCDSTSTIWLRKCILWSLGQAGRDWHVAIIWLALLIPWKYQNYTRKILDVFGANINGAEKVIIN